MDLGIKFNFTTMHLNFDGGVDQRIHDTLVTSSSGFGSDRSEVSSILLCIIGISCKIFHTISCVSLFDRLLFLLPNKVNLKQYSCST